MQKKNVEKWNTTSGAAFADASEKVCYLIVLCFFGYFCDHYVL